MMSRGGERLVDCGGRVGTGRYIMQAPLKNCSLRKQMSGLEVFMTEFISMCQRLVVIG